MGEGKEKCYWEDDNCLRKEGEEGGEKNKCGKYKEESDCVDRKKCYWKDNNCLRNKGEEGGEKKKKCRDLEEAECIKTEGKCVWKGGECKGKKKKDNKKDNKKKDKEKKGCIDITKETCIEREDKGCTWNGSSCEFDCSSYEEKEVCTSKKRGQYCEWDGNACRKKGSVLTLFKAVDADDTSSKKGDEYTDEYNCTKQVKETLGGTKDWGTKKCEWEFGMCKDLKCEKQTVPADCVRKFQCQWIQGEDLDSGRCAFWKRREMHEE